MIASRPIVSQFTHLPVLPADLSDVKLCFVLAATEGLRKSWLVFLTREPRLGGSAANLCQRRQNRRSAGISLGAGVPAGTRASLFLRFATHRRYVLRSERRMDARLVDAYRLTLEAGAALTHWGLASWGPAMASSSRIRCFSRTPSPASSPATCTSANAPTSGSVSLPFGSAKGPTPVAFDLHWSIAKTVQWLTTEPLFTHH